MYIFSKLYLYIIYKPYIHPYNSNSGFAKEMQEYDKEGKCGSHDACRIGAPRRQRGIAEDARAHIDSPAAFRAFCL